MCSVEGTGAGGGGRAPLAGRGWEPVDPRHGTSRGRSEKPPVWGCSSVCSAAGPWGAVAVGSRAPADFEGSANSCCEASGQEGVTLALPGAARLARLRALWCGSR